MAVTIKQIAQLAGLSVPTVSRILNNDGDPFRLETREIVFKAAQQLGYRPNTYRMALRTKKFNVVGLLFCSDESQSALARLTHFALLGELHKQNKHLLAGQFCGDTHDGKEPLPKMLREWSVDGILIDAPAATSAEAERWMEKTNIPAIYLNARRDADCVYADERGGAREGTERLLKLGHQRVTYLNLGGRGKQSQADSRAGYEAAMKAAGLTPRSVVDPVPAGERLEFLSNWIRSHPAKTFPTAVFCGDAGCAMPLYTAARVAGLSVPGDVSILAAHDGPVDSLGVRLDVMCLPTAELATAGLEALDRKIADSSREIPPTSLPLTYQQGVTVGRAAGHK